MSQNAKDYKKIQSYVVEEINKVRLPKQTGGSGGGGGSVTTHSIDGSLHTGTLADAQAPQFLKVDGSRALTGNLAVDALVTIDGVDLSVHAADPDAHHLRAAAGDGITVSGSQVVSVRLHTDSGLQFSSAQLQIGTTNSITAGSSGGVAGATHGHAVEAYSNQITNPGHLVKSDASGFVTFEKVTANTLSADVHLTIDPGGDVLFPQVQQVRSVNYTAGIPIQGWWIGQHNVGAVPSTTRNAMQIYSITVDELRARTFVVDEVRVDRGEEFVTKSYGVVALEFITPSLVGGFVTAWFEDSPAFSGPIFSDGDYLLFRIIDQSGGGLTIANLLFTVSGYINLAGAFQSWLLTLIEGPGDFTILKGATGWDFGVSGQGYIHSSVIDTSGAPYVDIRTWETGGGAGGPLDGTTTTHVRIGKLISSLDATMSPTGWGLFSDNAYLKGILVAGGGNIRLDSGGGHIATFNSNIGATSNRLSLNWLTPTGAETGFFGGRSWNGTDFQVMISSTGVSGSSWGTIALRATKASDGIAYGLNDALPGILLVQPESIFIGPNKGLRVASSTTELATTVPGGEIYADTIHADTLIATSISGSVLGSAEWEFAGSMKIDSNSGSNTVVTITNEGAGRADLNVDRDIIVGGLVDGVDLSGLSSAYTAHIANADAHHATATAGDGITVTGQQIAVNASNLADGDFGIEVFSNDFRAKLATNGGLTLAGGISISLASPSGLQLSSNELSIDNAIAGAGLAISAKVLSVGQGDGLTVAADSIALATPSTVSTTSANSVSPTTHTHGVLAASNPGANEVLLKSTVAGGLTLESLLVNGAVTVGQTLLTGGSGFRVIYHTHDAAHVHVVVNPTGGWTLDEQFGVDIDDNLLVRGYIVGKHAIQISGAVAIIHYDGPETNTGGEDRTHMGQVPLAIGNTPIFVSGKFGKGASFGPAATAMIDNPSFETNTTGWTSSNASLTRVAKEPFHGGWCLQAASTANPGIVWTTANANTANGTSYTFVVWMRVIGASVPCRVAIQNAAGSVTYGTQSVTVTNEWKHFIVTATATEVNQARATIVIDQSGTSVFIDGAQLYENLSAGIDFSPGSRAGSAYYEYATQGVQPSQGTVMLWARPATAGGVDQFAFVCQTDSTNRLWIYAEGASSKWRVDVADGGQTSINTIVTNTWVHLCLTWENGTARFYVNGTQQGADITYTAFSTIGASYFVGYTANTFRGIIDDLVIANRAVPPDEIRAIYESNAPVFAETSTWHFRAGRNRVWADAEGLWVVNGLGQAAFAVYAGDDDGTGSKSWGGVTLNASDILMGDLGRGGYVKWDDSTATLEVKGRILLEASSTGISNFTDANLDNITNGSTYARVLSTDITAGHIQLDATVNGTYSKVLSTIISAGLIQVGSGTKDSTLDGWHISSTEIVGQLDGADQVVLGTDGKLYAGGGKVRMDAASLSLEAAAAPDFASYSVLGWRRPGSETIDAYIFGVSESATSSAEMWFDLRSSANSAYRWLFGGGEKMTLNGSGDLTVLGGLGVGAAPDRPFLMQGTSAVGGVAFAVYDNATPTGTSEGPSFQFGFNGGTSKYVLAGDILTRFQFVGQANDFIYVGAELRSTITTGGNIARASHIADLTFWTKNSGSASPVQRMLLTGSGNLGLNTTAGFGSGAGVMGIANAATNPSTNPSGGGVLYADGGALKWRGSAGSVTQLAPA